MLLLLIALIGITTTQPAILDQTDEEWTAPGYNVVEEISINPLDYGEPISWGENCNGPTASIGCQGFFVPTDDGEKWRVIMLLKDKIVVLQEDEEPRDIPLTCSSPPRGIIYSRNGKYALVMGPVLESSRDAIYSREAEFIDIETGEVRTFEPLQNTGWTGMQFVNDDGSIYRWGYRGANLLEYYDSHHNLIFSNELNFGYCGKYSHASDGSIILFTVYDSMRAYDKEGRLLWSLELERIPSTSPLVSADGSFVLLSTRSGGGLECFNGHTGELLWDEFETGTTAPVPSVSGHGWAVTFGNRGLLFGSDAGSRESINYLRYPAETWDHGVPVAVASNGACLTMAVSLPPVYQNNHIRKIIHSDKQGNILWVSSPFSVASSPLNIHSPNNNIESELGCGTYSIQSDGERFIYTDYEYVMIMRVEGGDEE